MQGFQRGHRQADSYGGGPSSSSWSLPPLSLANTLALQAAFALQGATDAMKLSLAGQHLSNDKVCPRAHSSCPPPSPCPALEPPPAPFVTRPPG